MLHAGFLPSQENPQLATTEESTPFHICYFSFPPIKTIGSVFQGPLTLPSKQSQQIGPWWSNWWRQRGLTSWASSWETMELWYGCPKEYFWNGTGVSFSYSLRGRHNPPTCFFHGLPSPDTLYLCVYTSSLDSKGLILLSAHSCRCGKKKFLKPFNGRCIELMEGSMNIFSEHASL